MCGLDLALHPYCSVTLAKPVTGHAPSAGAGALAHGQGIGVTVEREQNDTWWTPRADQWLRLCTSNIGDMDSIPGQGTKIPHAPKKKKKHGFCPGLIPGTSVLFWGYLSLNPFSRHLTDHPFGTPLEGLHPTPFFFSCLLDNSRPNKQLKPSINLSFSPQVLSFLKFPNVFREL